MVKICECIMLICFGLSWPISVYKSIVSRSTKGKSPFFLIAIITGYIAGIAGKLMGGDISYTLVLYVFNLLVVSTDLILYFVNRANERKAALLDVQ
ncbi:MAG: hypothetical protein IJ493_10340 [Clostridia bacterium]|nr:hypothetical protein [Clostridia bacterium]